MPQVEQISIEQSKYQVAFDFGVEGAAAIAAEADVIVWVDAIVWVDVVEPAISLAALPARAAVIAADFRTSSAAAAWVLRLQQLLGRRIRIAVIAAGAQRADGHARYAVEDQLAAGAVIDELAALGLDATSPEAATAQAAYQGLKRAVGHLLTASVSAAQLERTTPQASAKIDRALGADDVIVHRPHPEL